MGSLISWRLGQWALSLSLSQYQLHRKTFFAFIFLSYKKLTGGQARNVWLGNISACSFFFFISSVECLLLFRLLRCVFFFVSVVFFFSVVFFYFRLLRWVLFIFVPGEFFFCLLCWVFFFRLIRCFLFSSPPLSVFFHFRLLRWVFFLFSSRPLSEVQRFQRTGFWHRESFSFLLNEGLMVTAMDDWRKEIKRGYLESSAGLGTL